MRLYFYWLIVAFSIIILGCSDPSPNQPVSTQLVKTETLPNGMIFGKYELTQKEWIAVMDTNPSSLPNDSLPVETISWYDAIEFCNKLSEKEGFKKCYTIQDTVVEWDTTANGYRLPTMAEWEYACRAGTTTDFYTGNMTEPICDTIDPALDKAGWYCANSGNMPHRGGFKAPNAFGLYDMHGNVWEWCWDRAEFAPQTRTLKGGAWLNSAFLAKAAVFYNLPPVLKYPVYGLRVTRKP